MTTSGVDVVDRLHAAGLAKGDPLGLALVRDGRFGIATSSGALSFGGDTGPAVVSLIEETLRPRWTWWSSETAETLVAAGVRVSRCWDIAAAHRLLFGGWKADPGLVWAQLHGLAPESLPAPKSRDLFNYTDYDGNLDDPLRSDGHLHPEWAIGGWAESTERIVRWAELAFATAVLQRNKLTDLADHPRAASTVRSESAAELLCVELAADGLPMDRLTAEEIIGRIVGPRTRNEVEAAHERARRDAEVLRHVPRSARIDLRSPAQVRSLLRSIGLDLPDTRAWRLRELSDTHPVVEALLTWRKAERVATTYGYGWVDEHLADDGRLRGSWTGCDGAAGRMTASAGLHNMPVEMRGAVVAEEGKVFVRADLRQIEPRVLAVISGDAALARACRDDDIYAPVAAQLGVDRATAKVAVLGAMYGQTTGVGARALRRLEATYPVAMSYLSDADRSGHAGRDLRTYGGRLVKMWSANNAEIDEKEARRIESARGRYGRNALVQGAAAELFKVWAVTVRARADACGAEIVLCLHDELLVQVAEDRSADGTSLVEDCLHEAVRNLAPDDSVRFFADVSVVKTWSDAKV
ncbi:MAG: DNA polymerase [Acidimicrobiales bacterium]